MNQVALYVFVIATLVLVTGCATASKEQVHLMRIEIDDLTQRVDVLEADLARLTAASPPECDVPDDRD